MKRQRCLIADDEPLACEYLRTLLAALPDVEVVAKAHRVETAVQAVQEHEPDVLLLDIQMPNGGGFEVMRRLASPPPVVFVTAYDHYALRVFEVNAVDYLLKPVVPERSEEALARVGHSRPGGRKKRVSSNLPLDANDLVMLEVGNSGHFRKTPEILSIRADGKYTHVHCTGGDCYYVRRGIESWRGMLSPDIFIRLDRGLVLNRNQVHRVDFEGRNAVVKLGVEKLEIQLGRTAATRIRRQLDVPRRKD